MLIVDSVCLKIIDPHSQLVAVGNQLHYQRTTPFDDDSAGYPTVVLPDLLTERIHGISVCRLATGHHRIVCHGGKELVQLTLTDNTLSVTSRRVSINEWISSALLYEDGAQLVLLTAHGAVVRMAAEWSGDDRRRTSDIAEVVKCPDKSTLYCSLIVDDGRGWPGLTFFGGTAFGQMIVWRVCDGVPVILHRVDCHNGVILSINCSLDQGLLTTTSDDRSLKVWRLDSAHNFDSIRPSKTLFGHTGRVFRCKLIVYDSTPFALSAGEDQLLCVWNLATGDLIHRQPLGAAIWFVDYDPVHRVVFASGADGNCKRVEIASILDGTRTRCLEIGQLPHQTDGEHVAKVRFLECGYVAVVTSENRLACGHPGTHWSCPIQAAFKISLLETQANRIAIAGYKVLEVYEFNALSHSLKLSQQIDVMDEMIRSCHFLDASTYLVCGQTGRAAIVDQSGVVHFRLVASREPWATVVLSLRGLLLIGDRTGHLHVYESDEEGVHHRTSVKHVHGRLGCTVLQTDPDASDGRHTAIMSAGHDGTVKYLQLDVKTFTLTVRQSVTVPITWIEKVFPSLGLIAGFNSNKFVVWNRRQRAIVAEIECGGGHRYSDVYCTATTGEGDFVFLRNKSLCWNRFKRADGMQQGASNHNWHSMSCTSVVTMHTADKSTVLFSGGDDNLCKVHLYDGTRIQHLVDICTHVSSIKTICVHTLVQGTAWRLFAAGGRAQISVSEVEYQPAGRTVRVTEVSDFMLRMSDAQRKRLGTANVIEFDPETRFMSLVLVGSSDVYVGCSDGFIRHFKWSPDGVVLHAAVLYGKCVLQVRAIDGWLVSAATDGRICFWTTDLVAESRPVAVISHHESGIQSMDWTRVEGNVVQVVTGGDDQSVVMSTLEVGRQDVRVLATTHLENVHTAQVNGVRFTSDALYTTGVDQTVFRWSRAGQSPRQIARSCVADIKGVCMVSSQSEVLVYGHGVQTFPVSESE